MNRTVGNTLVVPPFDCAWLMDKHLRFPEPGRGCIAFEACALNDVTVVFKEKAGSRHYRTDSDPNYTIVFGSHRNKRLKIEVDGSPVVDAPGVEVSPSHFKKFWIKIYDGHLTVGKGLPGKHVIVNWNQHGECCKVQYIGLSSWDKHVGYRNIRVLPAYSDSTSFSRRSLHISGASHGLTSFLESSQFSDLQLCVGMEQQTIPVHRIVLASTCCNFLKSLVIVDGVTILPNFDYSICRIVLEYLYSGQVEIPVSLLTPVSQLSQVLGIESLTCQCKDGLSDVYITRNCESIHMESKASLRASDCQFNSLCFAIDHSKLKSYLDSGEYADVEISLDGENLGIQAHRLILCAWSDPFAKMFTNGMIETNTIKIHIKDVEVDAFMGMLKFMYSAQIDLEDDGNIQWPLLSLMLLADRFGVKELQQACCDKLQKAISEESVYSILEVATMLPACESLQDACLKYLAKHFEFCSCCPVDFKELGFFELERILQNPDLSVSTEEKVLNAIMTWASVGSDISCWRDAKKHQLNDLFNERLTCLGILLHHVRFAFLPVPLLHELQSCTLSSCLPNLKELATEALEYLAPQRESKPYEENFIQPSSNSNRHRLIQSIEKNLKFSHRPSNMKELFYICDGDSNGVIYFCGTSYGAHPWMNPVLIKKISVSASSPPSRCTDSKALVSRQYQCTSFAGPCFEGGCQTAWWKIDLSEGHQLMCNHYTVRQDGSVNYMRSWSLQGSVDDKSWMDLRSHYDERTLNQPGQYASWPVYGANTLIPFRFFRVIVTGPTTSSIHPWNVCLCYIELYGYFQ